jgi:glycosyltransferase involved in cell wall biosynthesis
MQSEVSDLAVLQVLPALETGGVERGTVEMAQAITKAGGRALVASSGGRLVTAIERAGARHLTFPLASKNPWRIWRNAAVLEDVIRRWGMRIVHARSRAPAWSAYLAAQRAGVHFLTTYHGVYREDFPLKRRYNAVMAKGELVIAISGHVAAQIETRHGVDPARIRVIPRGVDPASFNPELIVPDRLIRVSSAFRLPDGMPVVMLPARLTRWKGQTLLIEALARMQRRDAVAVMVGSDQGRARFAAELGLLAERLGVAARVRMVGHCDDMPAALMLADAVVNASLDPEPFGRTVIEAQAMGRPVVVPDHGGVAETVEHDVTGWRVLPGDAAALAARLDQMLALDDAARAELGAASRASVLAHYTTEAMQAATLGVYQELLG